MIDYDRMRREGPKLKAELTRAENALRKLRMQAGSNVFVEDAQGIANVRQKTIDACRTARDAWNEIGAWPDHWSRWQRALDDALGYHLPLEDL